MKNTDQKLTKQDLWKIYRSQFFIRSCLNFERFQNVGFTHAMGPIIDKYYDTPEEKQEIIERHMQLFLTQPMVASLPIGVAAAMEERLAMEGDIDPESIDSTKVALMGPLAALGDSLLNGTLRPIAAGIACSLSIQGSALGPVIFLVLMSIMTLGVRYLGVFKGYSQGASFVINMQKSGVIEQIAELASVAAFIVIGGFVVTNIGVPLKLAYTSGDTVIDVIGTINGMLPNFLSVVLTLLCAWLMQKKKVSAVLLMAIIMVLAIVLTYIGLM
ncbi:MAG TPA: PTS system mannose/fructose/sorbose family transporter subunit IID [Erysipelotrichaceae bacterium]|jgi:PTS system mannose-specific IID component/fructoselysine and glucoselysine-specific PTS system IID component|nr:PTS system mannose/fructose/sorbose family transporter subunit IID [Erysipelotrichia bacterium]HPX31989.1 PTS system mannose/fructose/sorbose family transporter subunit IID [Erysipelotrichaceae bacterium]HQA84970.1 PTS system mannose/fructose/sorbose family transporter subunit IID [Erysipelotrichaceae bacterium]